MSAIEIALHKVMPLPRRSSKIVAISPLRAWFSEAAIRLSKSIADGGPARDKRPEMAGNPWARPIGLAGSR